MNEIYNTPTDEDGYKKLAEHFKAEGERYKAALYDKEQECAGLFSTNKMLAIDNKVLRGRLEGAAKLL